MEPTDFSAEELPLPANELARLDKAYLWHPFTPMRQYMESDPLILVGGKGCRVLDTRGRWYYDGTASIWLNVHGHGVEAIESAIRAELARGAHTTLLGQGNVPSVLLAKRLVEVAPPGLERVFFSDSGAGAVEAALKIAVQYWANRGYRGKHLILGFHDNYHGDTLGAVGVAPDDLFHAPFLGLLPGHPRVDYPGFRPEEDPGGADALRRVLARVEALLASRGGEIAAVIVEPVEGAGGIIPSPPGFLRGLLEVCRRREALLIVDEVATGFGRTGPLFACGGQGVTPDLLCLGKGITGGYLPLSATLATREVFGAFLGEVAERKTFFHGHSYAGNPLACAAALASLKLLEELLPAMPGKAERVGSALGVLRDHPFVAEVRQAGLMVGIELAARRDPHIPFRYGQQSGFVVARHARRRGMLVRPVGPVIIFMPPLAASDSELGEMCAILRDAFADARPELEALSREVVA